MRPFIAALAIAAATVIAPPVLAQQAGDAAVTVKDYDVFVDPPTGFVFVKLPEGWKFAGKVDPAALDRLPPTVLTWLLPAEGDDAQRMARARRDAGTARADKS